MDETAVLAHAQQNPLYAAILIENYRAFMETNLICRYAILICLSEMAELQTAEPASIYVAHFLFGAIFMFEKATDCTAVDPRHMDCIFLKTVLDALKEGGFYQAYLKYAAGMQIGHQMHPLYARVQQQRGGVRGRPSLMYVVIMILSILANIGAIQINSANKYAQQLIRDFSLHPDSYDMKKEDPQTYFNLYFSKLRFTLNSAGSCLYQSFAFGTTPENIKSMFNNVYLEHSILKSDSHRQDMHHLFKSLDPIMLNKMADIHTIYLTDPEDVLEKVKQHGRDIYTILNTTYHNAAIVGKNVGYMEPFIKEAKNTSSIIMPPDALSASDAEMLEEKYGRSILDLELKAIKNKINLPELAGENIFGNDNSTDGIIITFVAYITGHAFNILYNTKNGKIGVFDFNNYVHISKAMYNIKNYRSVHRDSSGLTLRKIFYNLFTLEGLASLIIGGDLMGAKDENGNKDNGPPMYILEPGFWKGTDFYDNLNNALTNPNIKFHNKSIMRFAENPIMTYVKRYKQMTWLEGFVVDSIRIESLYNYNPSETDEKHIDESHYMHRNVFQGWGCMTLNTCAESAIEFVNTYGNIVAESVKTRDADKSFRTRIVSMYYNEANTQQQDLENYRRSQAPSGDANHVGGRRRRQRRTCTRRRRRNYSRKIHKSRCRRHMNKKYR